MLSPEQRAAVTAFRITAESLRNERSKATAPETIASLQRLEMINTLAADAIEQNPALAEQVRGLREALESIEYAITLSSVHMGGNHFYRLRSGYIEPQMQKIRSALALALPDAARQAAENAERAGLLEWVCTVDAHGIMPFDDIYRMWDRRRETELIDEIRKAGISKILIETRLRPASP